MPITLLHRVGCVQTEELAIYSTVFLVLPTVYGPAQCTCCNVETIHTTLTNFTYQTNI